MGPSPSGVDSLYIHVFFYLLFCTFVLTCQTEQHLLNEFLVLVALVYY